MLQSDRDNFKGFFRVVFALLFGLLIFLILPFKHPLILLLLIGGFFTLFTKISK